MEARTWIVAVDDRRIGGLVAAARPVSGTVAAAVVGGRDLAESIAEKGVDEVVLFEAAEGVPAEALAAAVAAEAAEEGVDLVLSNDTPAARIVAGAVAGKIGAAVVGSVVQLKTDGDAIVAEKSIANGKAVEEVKAKRLAAVYIGPDEDAAESSAPIREAAAQAADARIVGFEEAAGSGLGGARRIVGVGMGLAARDNLPIVEDLANALGAQIACTLPCCDDMRWYTSDRVLGSSHNTASPDLYIAVGISGSPNHTSGFRDAKVVVSVNKDPDAEIFNCSKYGIVGDLFDIVPAITEALK